MDFHPRNLGLSLPGLVSVSNPRMFRAQAASLILHSVVALLLVLPVFRIAVPSRPRDPDSNERPWGRVIYPLEALKSMARNKPGGGGSGGEENPVPPTKGKLPPFAWWQFTPPTLPHNPNPKFPEQATVLGPPELQVPNLPNLNYGIPDAQLFTDSAGPGHRGGFGNKCCGGMGPNGEGRGAGPGKDWGIGDGTPSAGEQVAALPECAYCPSPNFSDEARKAKLQGAVLLRLVVTPGGRAASISLVKGLGLGLDEKAVEAVRNWRFKPARDPSGRFVPMWVTVEVMFRLL